MVSQGRQETQRHAVSHCRQLVTPVTLLSVLDLVQQSVVISCIFLTYQLYDFSLKKQKHCSTKCSTPVINSQLQSVTVTEKECAFKLWSLMKMSVITKGLHLNIFSEKLRLYVESFSFCFFACFDVFVICSQVKLTLIVL